MCWEWSLTVTDPVSHNRDDKTLIIMNNVLTQGEPGSHYCDRYSALFSLNSPLLGFPPPIMADNPGPCVWNQWVMAQFKCIEQILPPIMRDGLTRHLQNINTPVAFRLFTHIICARKSIQRSFRVLKSSFIFYSYY